MACVFAGRGSGINVYLFSIYRAGKNHDTMSECRDSGQPGQTAQDCRGGHKVVLAGKAIAFTSLLGIVAAAS